MPEALQDTSPAAETMRETIDALEEFVGECEQYDPEDLPEGDDLVELGEDEEERDEELQRLLTEAQDAASDIIQNLYV